MSVVLGCKNRRRVVTTTLSVGVIRYQNMIRHFQSSEQHVRGTEDLPRPDFVLVFYRLL